MSSCQESKGISMVTTLNSNNRSVSRQQCRTLFAVCSFTGANFASAQATQKQVLLTFFRSFWRMHGYILIRFVIFCAVLSADSHSFEL